MQQQKEMPQKWEECTKFHLQLCVVGLGQEGMSASFVVTEGCQCQNPANLFKETFKIGLVQKGREKFYNLHLHFRYCSQSC